MSSAWVDFLLIVMARQCFMYKCLVCPNAGCILYSSTSMSTLETRNIHVLNPFKNPSKSPINIRSEEHITQTCVCVSISANVLKGDILKALIRGPFLRGFRVEGLRF